MPANPLVTAHSYTETVEKAQTRDLSLWTRIQLSGRINNTLHRALLLAGGPGESGMFRVSVAQRTSIPTSSR